jgi:polar amino acid transport system permease protein
VNLELLERYGPRMLDGLSVTVALVVASLLFGALFSLPVVLARVEGGRFLRAIAGAYIQFFRGTPVLAQLFLVYYGAGQFRVGLEEAGLWWLFRDAWFCALLAFTLNTAAYQAQILSGAIANVPRGQWEAARSLGLHTPAIYWRVVLPQALMVALRPYGNEVVLMIKASAVASVVTVFDLMGVTRLAFSRSFDFEVYFWAAGLYLLLTEGVRLVWGAMERRLTRHLAPAGAREMGGASTAAARTPVTAADEGRR